MNIREQLAIPRQLPRELNPEERLDNFDEVSKGFDEPTALIEAQRCLQCRKPLCVMGCPINLFLDVEQFNLQKNQVAIAAKSDTVAMKRYEVTKQRFLIGKIAVLDLNDADTRKDQNRRAYVQALQNYWNYFYNIRNLTLFDFINRKPLEADYDKLLE